MSVLGLKKNSFYQACPCSRISGWLRLVDLKTDILTEADIFMREPKLESKVRSGIIPTGSIPGCFTPNTNLAIHK